MIACIGECMVELSPAGDGLLRQGFAGDTFNTAVYLRALTGGPVRYVSAVGQDALSGAMLAAMAARGLDVAGVEQRADATVGLYLITLTGAERSFTYWRGQSAARGLARDAGRLGAALEGVRLAYLSGITLAILPGQDRARLLEVLGAFRAGGGRVAFDPNIRLRLWPDLGEMKAALDAAYALADFALPSFDDEAGVYGDASPAATAARVRAAGAREVVVKNGALPALAVWDGGEVEVHAPQVRALDTTGAGDSFNAGYLAARLAGRDPAAALALGHAVAAKVIQHPGALVPENVMAGLREMEP